MAYYLKPKVKEGDKSSKSKSDKEEKKDKEDVLAAIPPMATPAQIQEALRTNFKNLEGLYKNYLKTKDSSELSRILVAAITAKESGVGTDNRLRLRLVNQAAINPSKRQFLLEKWGIKVPPLPGSSSKLVTQECLASFSQFKERVCSQIQPDVKDPSRRVDNTAEILARCAVGKYQILPIYHIPGMQKQGNGEEKLLKIYQFITSDESQTKSAEKIIDNLGKRYDWNPECIMVSYYAGTKWGDKLKSDPNNPAFTAGQYGGHGSMKDYIKRTTDLANRAMVQKAA